MKLLVLFNPESGNGRARKLLPDIERCFKDQGVEIELLQSQRVGHARSLVEQARIGDFDGVIAAGGDGTMFEVINGLKAHPESEQIPVGVRTIKICSLQH